MDNSGPQPITAGDQKLVDAAKDVIMRNYILERHEVGAAVLCASGTIYTGINIEACAYGPCAEPVALGAAFSNGEREIRAIVAVWKDGYQYTVLSPCGNCRQLIADYAPDAMVILDVAGQLVKMTARNLLPYTYELF